MAEKKLGKVLKQTALAGAGAVGAGMLGVKVMESLKDKDPKTKAFISVGIGAALIYFGSRMKQPGIATGAAAIFLGTGARALMAPPDENATTNQQNGQQTYGSGNAVAPPLPDSPVQGPPSVPLLEVVIEDREGDRAYGYVKDLGSVQYLYQEDMPEPISINSVQNGVVNMMFKPEGIRIAGRPLVRVYDFVEGYGDEDINNDVTSEPEPVSGDGGSIERFTTQGGSRASRFYR